MTLSREDILKFRAPLPLDDHEVKIKVAPKKDDKGGMKKSMWLAYIDKTGIIPLIQDVDPNYSWIVVDKTRVSERLCVVTGRLIIGGNSYDGVGGATPNYDNDPYSEDTEKAAETDAFKRAAINVGVGLYLRNAPQIWVDGNLGSGYQAKDEAWKQFEAWYRKTYGGQPQQQKATAPNGNGKTDKAFPTVETANVFIDYWRTQGASDDDMLIALGVERFSLYPGTLEQANMSVKRLLADREVSFGATK